PTVWALHGVAHGLNTGDMLFSLSRMALHRLSDLGFTDHKVLRLTRLYDETCVALCEGQFIDIRTSESDELMSVELYFDMIGRKTAALIAASIEAGAILATDDDEIVRRYRAFGWALGLAFQLNDDLLGIWGQERATGKEPSDLARRKKTLPLIYAFEHDGPAALVESRGVTELADLDVVVVGGGGHVGLPLSLTFAAAGLCVAVYDTNEATLARIGRGEMPFMESGAEELLRSILPTGRLELSSDATIVGRANNIVVVIGTPVDEFLGPSMTVF